MCDGDEQVSGSQSISGLHALHTGFSSNVIYPGTLCSHVIIVISSLPTKEREKVAEDPFAPSEVLTEQVHAREAMAGVPVAMVICSSRDLDKVHTRDRTAGVAVAGVRNTSSLARWSDPSAPGKWKDESPAGGDLASGVWQRI